MGSHAEVPSAASWAERMRLLGSLRAERLAGEPSDRTLARAVGVSPTTVGAWLRGTRFPQQWEHVTTLVRAVRAGADKVGVTDAAAVFDLEVWRGAYRAEARLRATRTGIAAQAAQARVIVADAGPGRPLGEYADPAAAFELEVHRAFAPGTPAGGLLPELPAYVPRGHDRELGDVVERAAEGTSGMVVLVGRSSSGKTRACFEALGKLRGSGRPWRLWHPLSPTPPEALSAGLPEVVPHTVLWLNEAQGYLSDPVLGERVAAGLRALLGDPDRAPVLVLATLWSEHWQRLTRRDVGARTQARTLLEGRRVLVPPAFTAADARALDIRARHDVRLRQARDHAADGQITQYLAGVPTLLERCEDAPAGARAVLDAAIDARRLGWGSDLPDAFLADAAQGYLSQPEWDQADDEWFRQAVDYLEQPCGAIPGPLTRPRPRHLPGRPVPAAPLAYRLADALEQHGRHTRMSEYPPESLWAAARVHADPSTQIAMATAAGDRGLYRTETQLLATAARANATAAALLADSFVVPEPLRGEVARWTAGVVPLAEAGPLASYLSILYRNGHGDALAVLLSRHPGRHVTLGDPWDVGRLSDALRGIRGAATTAALAELAVLTTRLARFPATSGPAEVAAGAGTPPDDEVPSVRSAQPAAPAPEIDGATALASHITRLTEESRDDELMALLAEEPAARVPITNAGGVARLANRLFALWYPSYRTTSTRDQIGHLAWRERATLMLDRRAWAHVHLDDPRGVALLLRWLDTDLLQWANEPTRLLERLSRHHDPIYLHVRDQPSRDAQHLAWRWARETCIAFAMRAAEVSLTDARGVAALISHLSGEIDHDGLEPTGLPAVPAALERLLERNPAFHVPPLSSEHDTGTGAEALIGALRKVGDHRSGELVRRRAMAAGRYAFLTRGEFHDDHGLLPDGTPSPAWTWTDIEPSANR